MSKFQGSAIPATWEIPTFKTIEFYPRQTRFCVGIPIINENGRIETQLNRMKASGLLSLVDTIIADGGSTDGSTEPEHLQRTGVRTLLVKTSEGKLSAQLRMFFAYALTQGYEGMVIIDGNNKDGVEAIPLFLEALEQGWDYVQGSRYRQGGIEKNTPLSRRLAVQLLHAPIISLAARFPYTDTTNGFRAVSDRFLLDPRLQPFRHIFDTYNLHYYLSVMAPQLGYRVKEIPVSRIYPEIGNIPSKIKGFKTHWQILRQLFITAFGGYCPRSTQKF